MKFSKVLGAGLALGLLVQTAFAHHSTNGIYDENQVVELKGTVKEWRFINPHPSLVLTVTGDDGQTHDWDISYGGSAVAHLKRRGFAVDSFKPGEVIVVKGNPALAEGAYGILARENPVYEDGSPIIVAPPRPE